jgi:hypothetical protein
MAPRGSDYGQWSEAEWRGWLDERLNERKNVFKSDPDELAASYNRENTWAQAYADRELFELMQNADDAGAVSPEPTTMSVLLTRDSLLAANSGVPFGPEGLKSIILSDNSPKLLRGPPLTGHRGVGFRAVLGSAKTIVILSGRLSVGFSRENSLSWVEGLAREEPRIGDKVAQFKAAGLPTPAPIFSVPFYFDSASPDPKMSNETRLVLNELRSRYETVVCLLFDSPEVASRRVLGQIGRVTPRVVLSLQHVGSLDVTTPQGRISWVIDRKSGSVTFQLGTAAPQVWQLQSGPQVCLR